MSSLKLVCDDHSEYMTISNSNPPSGGNASVFEVRDNPTIVAKILKSKVNHGNRRKRFIFETTLLKQFSSLTDYLPAFKGKGTVEMPNDEWDNSPFYLMEYLERWDIFLARIKTIDQKLDFCIQLADAVDSLHELEIAHRDLKPKNLLFRIKEDKKHVVVSDLGLAISDEREDLTTWSDEPLGSEGFRPPELMYHNETLRPKDYFYSDVYQFVKTVYCVFKEQAWPFSDKYNAISKEFELQKYNNQPFIETIYRMVEKGINEDLFVRPTIHECKKMLWEAQNYYLRKKEYPDYVLDRELRRLKSISLNNNFIHLSDNSLIISFFDAVPMKGAVIQKFLGSQEKMSITKIHNSQDIFLDSEGKICDINIGNPNVTRHRIYKIEVNQGSPVSFAIFRIFGTLDELENKQICVSIRRIDEFDTLKISERIEEYRILNFGEKSDDAAVPMEDVGFQHL